MRLFQYLCFVLSSQSVSALLLRDCNACGLFRYEMSKDVSGKCVKKCAPFWMALMGYSCKTCSVAAAPTGSTPTATTPSVGPPAPTPTTPSGPSPPTPVSAPVAAAPSAVSGQMTMWTTSPSSILGSSCEYAQPVSIAKGSSWLVPHVNTLRYCAVDAALYQGGLGCGQCYRISYNGVGGTDPGRAGSAIVQVVDSGSAKEFDCYLDAFTAITGANTGAFPIQYSPVPCTAAPPTVVVLDGNNAWYVKVLLAGGTTGVKSAKLFVGAGSYTLQRTSGATWAASLTGITNQPVSFVLSYADGTTETLSGCFGGVWPVVTSTQCAK